MIKRKTPQVPPEYMLSTEDVQTEQSKAVGHTPRIPITGHPPPLRYPTVHAAGHRPSPHPSGRCRCGLAAPLAAHPNRGRLPRPPDRRLAL